MRCARHLASKMVIASQLVGSFPLMTQAFVQTSLPMTSVTMEDPPDALTPTDKDNQMVQMAFKDFDSRRLDAADKEFGLSIKKWKELNRPRDEIVSLLKGRANARLDNKDFKGSVADNNEALELMKVDGRKADGTTATYPEYPDTYVSRALAYEGLSDWSSALKDYDTAIGLWGGGRGENINPFVLTYRGNVLARLDKLNEAVLDYTASANSFNSMGEIARYSDAKANLALTLYQLGNTQEAVKNMKDVIRKNPGYADMHVALAANAWGEGNYIEALKEWKFTCNEISVGCDAYKDIGWLTTVRRWPPSLIEKFQQFLNREIPEKLKGSGALAPSSRG